MKQEVFEVKSKGAVVGEATANLPESCAEAAGLSEEEQKDCLTAMWYGLRVKAANVVRTAATGGPKSIPRMIANKLKDNPEAMAKVMKLLNMEPPAE